MSTSAPEAPQAPETPQPVPGPGPAQPPPRVLRRSSSDKMVAGVCGGVAHYLGVDPVLIRLAAVALALSGGVGILLYVIAAILLPVEGADSGAPAAARPGSGGMVAGVVLVLLGVFLLLRQVTPWLDASIAWPGVVVAIGLVILIGARRRP